MDPKSINLCKNKTYQANTEFSAPTTTFSLRNIGFIFKMFICMCVLYMFIIHASGDCFESSMNNIFILHYRYIIKCNTYNIKIFSG